MQIHTHALSWVGLWSLSEEVNLLVASIKANYWLEAPSETNYKGDYLQPFPRVFKRSDDTFSIKLWTDGAMHLVVDAELNAYEALNTVRVEEKYAPRSGHWHLSSGPQICWPTQILAFFISLTPATSPSHYDLYPNSRSLQYRSGCANPMVR
jgi:hypothetical protein